MDIFFCKQTEPFFYFVSPTLRKPFAKTRSKESEGESMSRVKSDKELVRRMQQGERSAYAEFIDSYGARVLRLARRYVVSPSDAEDLVQEVFVEIYRSIGAFRGESSLSTYVYSIAVHRCQRHAQGKRIETLPMLENDSEADTDWRNSPEASAAKSELSDRVQVAMGELTGFQREVVILHELHGLTYQECASVLEIPIGTVKSRLSGAFGRLRKSLHGYVFGENAPTGCSPKAQCGKEVAR